MTGLASGKRGYKRHTPLSAVFHALRTAVAFLMAPIHYAFWKWRETEAVIISCWFEMCWGWWLIANSTTFEGGNLEGMDATLYTYGGLWVGVVLFGQGFLRWLSAWSQSRYWVGPLHNAAAILTFSFMVWVCGMSEGWASGLTVLHIGMLGVQVYCFVWSVATRWAMLNYTPKGRSSGGYR